MSGFVGAAEAVIDALVADVSIGGVSLYGFEIPEHLEWGGEQAVIIHRLPGGQRVFVVNGPDDAPISWSGYFSGPLASYRARALDAIRTAGQPVPLQWPGFTRNVLVTQFTCTSAEGGNLLPYRIRCEVIPDPAGASTPSTLDAVTADVSSSLGISLPNPTAAFTQAAAALGQVQTLVPLTGALSQGAGVTTALAASLSGATTLISTGLGVTEKALAAITGGAGVLGSADPVTAIANLGSASGLTQSLAGLSQMQGFAQRAATNLANAGG